MRDVRMRGFAERANVAEVEDFLALHVRALPAEAVPVVASPGRVLTVDVLSEVLEHLESAGLRASR